MDSVPQNLRNWQDQLNAAIRAHRNLVGRSNLNPRDRTLQLKVQAAEKLIVRICQAQKPLLDDYKRGCERRRATLNAKNGTAVIKDRAKSVEDVLEEGVRHHFCTSTLERWGNSVGGLSPEKKKKMNFLALFDLVTPKLSSDIVESKAPHRKRRQELVNTDFQVLLGHPVDSSAPGCKRFRTATSAAAAAASAVAAAACSSKADPAATASSSQGILTRSSRRARGQDSTASTSLSATAADKSPMDSDARQESGNADDSESRFCCAGCLSIVPKPPAACRSTVGLCSACSGRRESRASGAIGLPPPAAAAEAPTAEPEAAPKTTVTEEVTNAAMDAANSSPVDSIAAAEMENKSLLQEAERWKRSLFDQEQTRQMLVEKNFRAEKKIKNLVAQLNKVTGM